MASGSKAFRHHSLQDADSIVDLLNALTDGLSRGKLKLGDDDSDIQLRPRGLLELSIEADREDGINTLNLQLRWNDAGRKLDRKALKIR